MTRRNAMASTAAATVSLALIPSVAAPPRRDARPAGQRAHSDDRAEPIIAALGAYAAATAETIAAHAPYAIAEGKLSPGMLSGPSIKLRRNPDRLARSHDDIEAYRLEIVADCEHATAHSTAEHQAQVIAASASGFAEMHREFDEVKARYDAAYREAGFDVARIRLVAAFDAERAALEEIAKIQPATISGVAKLQAFLGTMLADVATEDLDIVQAISRNLAAATAAMVEGPLRRVTQYRPYENA